MVDNFKNVASGVNQMAKRETPFINESNHISVNGNTYDDLKSALKYYESPTAEFIKDYYGVEVDSSINTTNSIIYEFNSFFNSHIKTQILFNKLETIQANILSNWELTKKDGEEYIPVDTLDFINLSQSVNIDDEFLKEFSFNLITSDKFLVHTSIDESSITFKTRKSDEYFILNDVLHIVTMIDEDNFYVEKETLTNYTLLQITKDKRGKYKEVVLESVEKTLALPAFYVEINSNANIITSASLETSLMYSELYTSLQKEITVSPTTLIADKRLAPNGHLNFFKNAIISIEKPDSMDALASDNSEIKYSQMNMRAGEFEAVSKLLNTQLDNILLADQQELGLDPTATAVNANLSEVAKKINMLKINLANNVNSILFNILNIEDYIIIIEEYKVDTKELNNNLDAQEIDKGLDTRLNILRKRNPEWTEEQLLKNYLTIELKLGNALNAEEEELARSYGLLKEFQSEGIDILSDNIDEIDEPEQDGEEV